MKTKKTNMKRLLVLLAVACLVVGVLNISAMASETASEPAADTSPAIYVYQKNQNSVVGVITSAQVWVRGSGTETQPLSQGSGVVIREGGYIMTNNHVVSDETNQYELSYEVLLPSGETVPATLMGNDSSTDIAVLKVDEEYASQLTPVTVGSSASLMVGSTVIAIGNPTGEALANTLTQGVVSALERTNISLKAGNTTREISYIQHDAAINSGNSGGGLFNYKGELIGINTLKTSGITSSGMTLEGLGFAIPIDNAYEVASDLIEYGQVQRPMLGIMCTTQEGPDEPMKGQPPASIWVQSFTANSGAEAAGILQYDFIYSIDGERVTTMLELTSRLDKYQPGDTVKVTVVRYENLIAYLNGQSSNSGYRTSLSGDYEMLTFDVTLQLPGTDGE